MAFSTLSVVKCLRYLNLIHYLIWNGESRKRWAPKSLEDLHIRGMKHYWLFRRQRLQETRYLKKKQGEICHAFLCFSKINVLAVKETSTDWDWVWARHEHSKPDMSILSQCTTSHCQCCYSQNAHCVRLWEITLHALITSEMPQSPPLSHTSKWLQNRWGCVDIFTNRYRCCTLVKAMANWWSQLLLSKLQTVV